VHRFTDKFSKRGNKGDVHRIDATVSHSAKPRCGRGVHVRVEQGAFHRRRSDCCNKSTRMRRHTPPVKDELRWNEGLRKARVCFPTCTPERKTLHCSKGIVSMEERSLNPSHLVAKLCWRTCTGQQAPAPPSANVASLRKETRLGTGT